MILSVFDPEVEEMEEFFINIKNVVICLIEEYYVQAGF
jgi:hypothetical protein